MLYRIIIAFSLLLFIGVQSFTVAHAASHAHEPHDQDCVSCDIAVASDDHIPLLPPATQKPDPFIYELRDYTSPSLIENFKQAPTCVPPPRAPPA